MKRLLALLLGLSLMLVAVPSAYAVDTGSTLRLPWSPINTLDPARLVYANEFGIVEQVYDGLAGLDNNLNTVPAIAASWNSSPDARTWTFTLNPNVRFHNGRLLKAKDIVYSWNRAKKANGPYVSYFDNIVSYSAPSNFSFVVTLSNPDAGFPTLTTLPIFYPIPKEAASTIATVPVGTGPFQYKSFDWNKKLVLVKTPGYYGGEAYLSGVEYHFYTDTTFAKEWNDFQKGKIDVTRIPASQWAGISGDPHVITQTLMSTMTLGFDQNVFPDGNVRKALQQALDRDAVIAAVGWSYGGTLEKAHGVVSPGKGSYDNSDINVTYDPTNALTMLAAAGWTDTNSDNILDNGAGTNLTIVLGDSTSATTHARQQAIANSWSNIGGTGKGAQVSLTMTAASITAPTTGWMSDYPDPGNDLQPYMTGAYYGNKLHYSSNTFDDFVEAGLTATDATTRNTAFHNADAQLVLTDAAVVPLYYGAIVPLLTKPYVHDFVVTSRGSEATDLKSVWMTAAPPRVQLLKPANGAALKNRTPLLQWKATTGAVTYDVQVFKNKTTGSPLISQSAGTNSYQTSTLAKGNTYYWRVRACNTEICGKWSAFWSFLEK